MHAPHVLIVEDDADNRKILTYHIRKIEGATWSEAGDGSQALDAVQSDGADIIIMDVNMPVMDGLTATREIRALDGSAAQTPILALTAASSPEEQAACYDAGVTDIMAKPIIDAKVLLAKIQACLKSTQRS